MCSIKQDVESVSVVEKDKRAIELFKNVILPQFEYKDKVRIINADAYEFLETMQDKEYDYAFVDIYHDAGDGLEVYEKFRKKTGRFCHTEFAYWIEKTIKYYL